MTARDATRDTEQAQDLLQLVRTCIEEGDAPRARALSDEALTRTRHRVGEHHPDYADMLWDLAELWLNQDPAQARAWFRRSSEIYAASGETQGRALALRGKAVAEVDLGRLVEAAATLEACLAELDPSGEEAAIVRQEIDQVRSTVARPNESKESTDAPADTFSQALTLLQRALKLNAAGDRGAVEDVCDEAAKLLAAFQDESHPGVANLYNFLGGLYLESGRGSDAVKWLSLARTLGDKHGYVTDPANEPPVRNAVLTSLAFALSDVGDFDGAIASAKEACGLLEEIAEHGLPYVVALNTYSKVALATGDIDAAEHATRRSLGVLTKLALDPEPGRTQLFQAATLQLATILAQRGAHAEVESQAEAYLDEARRTRTGDLPRILQLRARARIGRGDVVGAAEDYRMALVSATRSSREARANAIGEEYIALLIRAGEIDKALAWAAQANANEETILEALFRRESEVGHRAIVSSHRAAFDALLRLVLAHPERALARDVALHAALRRKHLAREHALAQRELAASDGELAAFAHGVRRARLTLHEVEFDLWRAQAWMGIASHLRREGHEATPEQVLACAKEQYGLVHQVSRGRQALTSLQKEVAARFSRTSLAERMRGVTSEAAIRALPSQCTLIEFVLANVGESPADPADSAMRSDRELSLRAAPTERYVAIVAASRAPDRTRIFDLGPAQVINDLVEAFWSEGDVRQEVGVRLRELVFDPLREAVEHDNVIVSPDGALERVPFAALPDGDRHLLDAYCFSGIPSGRDFLRPLGARESGPSIVIANPDYDAKGGSSRTPALDALLDQMLGSDGCPPGASFEPLPETDAEGNEIARVIGAQAYLRERASKTVVLRSRSPRILHLATHGYACDYRLRYAQTHPRVLASVQHNPPPPLSENAELIDQLHTLPHPSLRSGLVLAGVNRWLRHGQVSPENGNGILTAEEVLVLELSGTELVTLSACETGLGDIQRAEGVTGLARAFLLAGARAVLVSMWRVPDLETKELMIDFYGRLLAGESRAQALRQSQLALRQRRPDSRWWGAFTLIGEREPFDPLSVTENAEPGPAPQSRSSDPKTERRPRLMLAAVGLGALSLATWGALSSTHKTEPPPAPEPAPASVVEVPATSATKPAAESVPRARLVDGTNLELKPLPKEVAEPSPTARKRIVRWTGRECIYVEDPLFMRVRVTKATADDWGAKLKLAVLEDMGPQPWGKPTIEVSTAWLGATMKGDSLSARFVGWNLSCDGASVARERSAAGRR